MDPWAVLRRLRALPLVEATTRDEDINGGDAVEALCDVRELLDEALARRDPVDQAFAFACAAAVAEEALTPPQRIDLRRRLIAAERDALQARLAKGPL